VLDAVEPGIPIRRRPESLAAFAGLVLIAILLGLAEPGAASAGRSPSPSRETGISSDEFARACDVDGIPLIWLQDVSGFDIGEEAERLGLLGWGSSLIYANSTQRSPVFTVLLRRASGAGYYAECGRPYDPIVQLSTPVSRLSVMEGRTLAIATFNTKLDDEFEVATRDPEERAAVLAGMREVEQRIEQDMDPYVSARQLDTDEIVALGELRGWLEGCVELAYQSIGYRTVKNPRIWSLHDLARLSGTPRDEPLPCLAQPTADGGARLASPDVGILSGIAPPGAVLTPDAPVGWLEASGRVRLLTVPAGVAGVVQEGSPACPRPVGYGDCFSTLAPLGDGVALLDAARETPNDAGGDLVVRAPQVGRFYHRPAPDQPAYVQVGDALVAGKTIGLIEVMKTFFQVHYGDSATGDGLPAKARVVRFLVGDGDDVDQGQGLLEVEEEEEEKEREREE